MKTCHTFVRLSYISIGSDLKTEKSSDGNYDWSEECLHPIVQKTSKLQMFMLMLYHECRDAPCKPGFSNWQRPGMGQQHHAWNVDVSMDKGDLQMVNNPSPIKWKNNVRVYKMESFKNSTWVKFNIRKMKSLSSKIKFPHFLVCT